MSGQARPRGRARAGARAGRASGAARASGASDTVRAPAAAARLAEHPPSLPPELAALRSPFEALSLVVSLSSLSPPPLPSLPSPPGCAGTFQAVHQAVSNILGRPFTLADLAALAAVAPRLLSLAWMRRSLLDHGTSDDLRLPAGLPANPGDPSDPSDPSLLATADPPVLLICFATAFQPLPSSDLPASKRPKTARFKAPKTVRPAQLVTERSSAFLDALLSFLADCAAAGVDPVATLQTRSATAIPANPFDQPAAAPAAASASASPLTSAADTANADTDPQAAAPSATQLIAGLRQQPFYSSQMHGNAVHTMPARQASFGVLSPPLSTSHVWTSIQAASDISRLYTHQCRALELVMRHDRPHVILATQTSSGKSLVYQLPILHMLSQSQTSRALLVYPTKALAQDQKRAFGRMVGNVPGLVDWVKCDTFDGDTPSAMRRGIREGCQVVLTNPDMIHAAILPHHDLWRDFLAHLRFVVIDELHYYSGALGAHCAMVMRRLRRLCSLAGNDSLQFIGCSATISNPVEHMAAVLGVANVVSVTNDTSPTGVRHQILWNPPFRIPDDAQSGRASVIDESAKILVYFLSRGARTICFAKTRRACELVFKEALSQIQGSHPHLSAKLMSYRGGYSAADRRHIESQLFDGSLLAIIATNALELGIDIGSLDVVLHVGFPVSLASYRQQMGRAGRRSGGSDSISVAVLDGDSGSDQYYARYPEEVFGETRYEDIGVDLASVVVVEPHLQCAAAEMPLRLSGTGSDRSDEEWFAAEGESGAETRRRIQDLCEQYLRWDDVHGVYVCAARFEGRPASVTPLRSIGDEDGVQVMDASTGHVLEEVEADRVAMTLYEGAVFLHRGKSYLVSELNTRLRIARCRPTNVSYITAPLTTTAIDPLVRHGSIQLVSDTPSASNQQPSGPDVPPHAHTATVEHGTLTLTKRIYGVSHIDPRSQAVLTQVTLPLPTEITKPVSGLWIVVRLHTVHLLQHRGYDVNSSIHAAAHALRAVVPPLLASADLKPLVPFCVPPAMSSALAPRIALYDTTGYPALVAKVAGIAARAVEAAAMRLAECVCEDGCDACTHAVRCVCGNSGLSKHGAALLLAHLLGRS
ncbi:hypothetical protein BC831DRAFT_281394 [Entophlyctis helioformis]|nr:hypothetical protein BC831DRAFT_281394 [Entophlyctis helioformis]